MEGEDTWPERDLRATPHPYCAFVMSAPLDADLLRVESWTRSNYQEFDLSRVGNQPGDPSGGWREGNIVIAPGGRTKFTIYFDPVSARYWSLVNKQSDPAAERNVLALVSSSDLKRWKVHTIVLQHRDRRHHAWQYVDWRYDGDDIVAVSRTAWGNSHNFHDANYLTFHRINDFRKLVH